MAVANYAQKVQAENPTTQAEYPNTQAEKSGGLFCPCLNKFLSLYSDRAWLQCHKHLA